MNRSEFLEKLREALNQNVSPQVVQENVEYYGRYIDDERRKGRSEQEIMEELGDPWVIAQTIIDSEETKNGGEYIYESNSSYGSGNEYRSTDRQTNQVKIFRFDAWWKKLLLALVVIGVICIVVSIITGLVSLIAPIVIPILIIVLLIRLIKGLKE
ncbi:MAG: DUF1700 domain-containing protein [Bariatricus sp.]